MSIVTLENSGWKKLCKNSSPNASGLAALCKKLGYTYVETDTDLVVEPRACKRLIYLHSEYDRTNFSSAECEYGLTRLSSNIPAGLGSSVDNPEKFIAQFREAPPGSLKGLHALSGLVTLSSNEEFPHVMATKAVPAFFELFPEGRVHVAAVAPLLLELQATVRVLSPLEIFDRAELEPLGPLHARMMSEAHATLSENLGISFFEVILNFCFPQCFGIVCSRLNCEVIFIFPKPLEDPGRFPREIADFARRTSIFHERPSIEDLTKYLRREDFDQSKLIGRQIYKTTFAAREIGDVINWAIQRVDELWSYIFDFTRHVEVKTGYVSPLLQRKRLMTIERMLIETALTISEREPYIRKTLFFNLHDKYASLMVKPGDFKQRQRIFNRLLKKSHYSGVLRQKLRTIPEPFLSFVRKRGDEIFGAIHQEVLDDIWLKGRVGNKVVTTRKFVGDPTPDKPIPQFQDVVVNDETYVCRVIHGYRNSLHGYFLAHYGLEEDLALSKGSVPSALTELAWLFAFLLLEDPVGLCEGLWKETSG